MVMIVMISAQPDLTGWTAPTIIFHLLHTDPYSNAWKKYFQRNVFSGASVNKNCQNLSRLPILSTLRGFLHLHLHLHLTTNILSSKAVDVTL